MFVLCATERNWLALSRSELPLAEPVVGTVSWPAFVTLAPAATCCLVAVPASISVAWLDGLQAFRETFPFAPLVLVADQPLPRAVAKFGEVARGPLQMRRIWPTIQRACTRSLLGEAAQRATEALGRPLAVRTAFATACRADPPIRSVGALAKAVGVHRRTLWRQWRASGADQIANIDELLDWVLLLRASALVTGPGSADAVAERLGVHRHTLARVAGSCAELSLRDLTPDVAARIRAAFRDRVLDRFAAAGLMDRRPIVDGAALLGNPDDDRP